MLLGSAYAVKGAYDKAEAATQRALRLGGPEPAVKASLGYVYGLAEKRAEALQVLEEVKDLSDVSPYYLAWLHAGLGNEDQVFDLLEEAYKQRVPNMAFLKVEPPFRRYHSHPRFQALLKKMNFPE